MVVEAVVCSGRLTFIKLIQHFTAPLIFQKYFMGVAWSFILISSFSNNTFLSVKILNVQRCNLCFIFFVDKFLSSIEYKPFDKFTNRLLFASLVKQNFVWTCIVLAYLAQCRQYSSVSFACKSVCVCVLVCDRMLHVNNHSVSHSIPTFAQFPLVSIFNSFGYSEHVKHLQWEI